MSVFIFVSLQSPLQSGTSDDDFATPKGINKKSNSPAGGDSAASALAAKLRAKFHEIPAAKKSIGRPPNNSRATIRISPKFLNKNKDKTGTKAVSGQRNSSGTAGSAKATAAAAAAAGAGDNSASTDLEDFEQMPTFTIVNINDIMNQKSQNAVLVRKRKAAEEAAAAAAGEGGDENDLDAVESSEEDQKKSSSDDTESPSKPVINRRKTQHTKILSDDKLVKNAATANARASTATKLSPVKYVPVKSGAASANNNGRFKQGAHKPAILRQAPPPRILNSTLCKPAQGASLVTKLVTTSDIKKELNQQNNNTISSYGRSKENNVTSYTFTEKDGKLVPKKTLSPVKGVTSAGPRTPHVIQRSGPLATSPQSPDRRIKKITCFETWHVIKTPEPKRVIEKSILMVSLLKLGNDIKDIVLPSDQWTYKIILHQAFQPKKPAKSSITSADTESEGDKGTAESSADSATESEADVYTGEVQDPGIKPEDRHKYKPINIMFRRKQQNTQIRIQFDRTVIFKNGSFYINIDGKNIRLTAAPQYIHSFSDIETLLQIVNDINLKDKCVELTTHAL